MFERQAQSVYLVSTNRYHLDVYRILHEELP